MPELTLYYSPTCPYCSKVKAYLDSKGIEINLKNVQDNAEKRQELMDLGGKSQVPCLVIDGQALYESDAIIQWFEENWTKE